MKYAIRWLPVAIIEASAFIFFPQSSFMFNKRKTKAFSEFLIVNSQRDKEARTMGRNLNEVVNLMLIMHY